MSVKMIKTAVIGVGTMGSRYVRMLLNGEVEGMELAAVTRIGERHAELREHCIKAGIIIYPSADESLNAVQTGSQQLEAVIITTPHYSHSEIAVRAFSLGLNVMTDKPAGVYSRQAREMNAAADKYGKAFAIMFNQRTNPAYRRIKNIIESGKYGALRRVNWVVTDWYRPDGYYASGTWRATWKGEGGGVLLNQCPHNLDLLLWMCGMPESVQGFCTEGRFHDIEVEDDATIYMRWPNGAVGTFITSTGDASGINRLEISLEEAMLVYENGELRIGELYPEIGMSEREYRRTAAEYFRKLTGTWQNEKCESGPEPYNEMLSNFSACVRSGDVLIADGREGYNSLLLSNAVYLSSWTGRMIRLPQQGSSAEREFEIEFERQLNIRRGL